jgi:hypothetical protein
MLNHRQFVTAGKSVFTVKSKATEKHFTFKVSSPRGTPEENPVRFVSVMTGNDNENHFSTLGTIFGDGSYRHNRNKSKLSPDDVRAKAFEWVWKHIDNVPTDKMEFLPSCACCRCGRPLTNPTSVEMAIGPECAGKLGL